MPAATFTATLYTPGQPEQKLSAAQVDHLKVGDLLMPRRLFELTTYHLCVGVPRLVDRWLGLSPHPKRKHAWCEPLASGRHFVAYVRPNAADSGEAENPEATARLHQLTGHPLDELLLGPVLFITA